MPIDPNQPPVYLAQETVKLFSEKDARDTAFYTASTYGKNEVIADYQTIYDDILMDGKSEFAELAQADWERQQDRDNMQAGAAFLEDPSIGKEEKISFLHDFRMGIKPDYETIKDKYKQDLATQSIETSNAYEEQQDVIARDYPLLNEELNIEEDEVARHVVSDGLFTWMAKEVGTEAFAILNLATMMPALLNKISSTFGSAFAQKVEKGMMLMLIDCFIK